MAKPHTVDEEQNTGKSGFFTKNVLCLYGTTFLQCKEVRVHINYENRYLMSMINAMLKKLVLQRALPENYCEMIFS